MIKFYGKLMLFDVKNKNERIYKYGNVSKHLKTLIKKVNDGLCLGELRDNYSPNCNTNIENVSHCIDHIEYDNTSVNIIGRIIDTPKGKILQECIKNKIKFGLSLRCYGKILPNGIVKLSSIITIDIAPYDKCEFECAELKFEK